MNGGGERERETQNRKQIPGSELSAQSLVWGLNTQTAIMTWRSWSCVFVKNTQTAIMILHEVGRATDWDTQVLPKIISLSFWIFQEMLLFRGAWMAQSVKHPTSAQVTISWFMGWSPVSGSVLTAQSLEPASDPVSLFLSDPLPLALSLPLSLKNKH